MSPLVRVRGVEFAYRRGAPVLEGADLTVEPLASVAILGPNGIGKSTLLAVIAGHARPQAGVVELDGRPLAAYTRAEIARILAYVPQAERMPFDYSCLEYVLHGRTPQLRPLELPGARDCAIAQESLERVGLGGLAQRSVNELSGGERQLVMIARALAQQPRLLVLDEPTAHLDLANKRRVTDMLRALSAAGVTVILTTHEPEVAVAAATQVALMGRGGRVRFGSIDELLNEEALRAAYGTPVRVVRVDGQPVVLWSSGCGPSQSG